MKFVRERLPLLGGLVIACLASSCKETVVPQKDRLASIVPTNASCTPSAEGNNYQIYPKGDANAGVGDVMPYYDSGSGQFYLYYLKDQWDGSQRHPWYAYSTSNFYTFNSVSPGMMLACSSNGCDYDYSLGTGAVVKKGGTYYAFYTAHNPNYPSACVDRKEVIKLATSTGLNQAFVKQGLTLFPPAWNNFEELDNFRDPYVYFDAATSTYYLLVAARKQVSGVWRGVVAKWTSSDLLNWTYAGVLYDGGSVNYWMMETPQVFKINATYYLLYSDQTTGQIYYRKSSSLSGPWQLPSGAARFDGTSFYAAKAAVDAYGDWYLFGWTGRRTGNTDAGSAIWGGNMVTHKMYQKANQDLGLTVSHTLKSYLSTTSVPLTKNSQWGNVVNTIPGTQSYTLTSSAAYDVANVLYDALSAPRYMLNAKVSYSSAVRDFGFALSACDGYNQFYSLRFIPSQGRISLDTANRSGLTNSTVPLADVPFPLAANTEYDVTIVFEGSMMVVYINNEAALTTRVYRQPGTRWGIYADQSTASFKNIVVTKP